MDIKSRTTIIHKSTDAIFIHFTTFMMMMVCMLLIVMMMLMLLRFFFLLFRKGTLYSTYPTGRSGSTFKVKCFSIDYLIQICISIITFYYFSCRLQCTDNLFDTFQFVTFHFRGLIQQYNITKFNLLDNQIFNILFVNTLTGQIVATRKLTLQTQGIYHSHNTIQTTSPVRIPHT